MKVDNKSKNDLNMLITSKRKVSKSSRRESSFLEELKGAHGEKIKKQLDQLLELIDEQGERLSKKRTFKELIKYKKMIKGFVKEAVSKMYQVKEDYSPLQGKIYTVIKSVDKSLEDLTKMVVDKEEDRLNILGQLDEIRGLLIDLYR